MAIDIPLVSLSIKDIAPGDVVNDLLTAGDRGKQYLVPNVQKSLIDGSVRFHDSSRKRFSKTFEDLYKTTVSTKQREMKSVKADRNLIQRLLNAVTAGRPVEMDSVMKHELSTVPLSIAKVGGDMRSTPTAELIDILKGQINIPSELPETDRKTCVLIDGHALIKALGKPNGCQTFGEYADAFFNVVRSYFNRNISRVDVIFDVNQARSHLFVKGRKELDMLPPTRDALDLHCKRANNQAGIWLQADQNRSLYPHPQSHLPG